MKPFKVAAEVFGSDAMAAAEKILQALVAAVDGLDVQCALNMLAS